MVFPWDELNTLEQKWTMPFQERITAREVIDEIYDILVLAYVYGWDNVVKDLGVDIEVDTDKAVESVQRPVAGKTFSERVIEYVGSEDGEVTDAMWDEIIRIAETDTNRVFNEGADDAAEAAEQETGRVAMKRWHTMVDDRVRDTHFYLEGTVIPRNEKFHTYDGDEADKPGGFILPQNNIRCRCFLEYEWGK